MLTQHTHKRLIVIILCPHFFFLQCTVTLEITGFADKQFLVLPLAFLVLLPRERTQIGAKSQARRTISNGLTQWQTNSH